MLLLHFFALGTSLSLAQQVYIPANGTSVRPQCSTVTSEYPSGGITTSNYHFGNFSYTQTETVRTATPAPTRQFPTYALPYASFSHSFPDLAYTAWGNWYPNATVAPQNDTSPYGQASWSALWDDLPLTTFSRGIYSTTVSPTPIPTSSLVLPPPLYFGPQDCCSFPSSFMLGVAGAAAQVEGAIADEGRTPTTADVRDQLLSLQGTVIAPYFPNVTADYTAVEHYWLYKQDIARFAAMGIKYYAFSISWARILPFALPGTPVNLQALQHYKDVIDFAISKGVQPVITLLHGDAPLVFFGGANEYLEQLTVRNYFGYFNEGYQNSTFVEAFVNYGKIVMAHFADRVPLWVTVNEPQNGCISGPSFDHIIKAHAKLYHFYKEELKGQGRVTMKMSGAPGVPQDPRNESHLAAVAHFNDLTLGSFLNPLVLGQDYPEAFKMTIQDYIPLTEDDLNYLKDTMDIVSIDSYSIPAISALSDTTIPACAADNATTNAHYPTCVTSTQTTTNGWLMGPHDAYFMWATPTYLRTALAYMYDTYRKPVAITEFGFPRSTAYALDVPSIQYDVLRSEYYLSYMSEVLKAIWEDGVEVVGAFAWSWVDNWEWGTYGYEFGLQYNERGTQTRSFKRSFFDLVDFVESRRMREDE